MVRPKKAAPKSPRRFTVSLDAETYDALSAYADAARPRVTLAAAVEYAVRELLRSHKSKGARR